MATAKEEIDVSKKLSALYASANALYNVQGYHQEMLDELMNDSLVAKKKMEDMNVTLVAMMNTIHELQRQIQNK
jgi:hypothetical protein